MMFSRPPSRGARPRASPGGGWGIGNDAQVLFDYSFYAGARLSALSANGQSRGRPVRLKRSTPLSRLSPVGGRAEGNLAVPGRSLLKRGPGVCNAPQCESSASRALEKERRTPFSGGSNLWHTPLVRLLTLTECLAGLVSSRCWRLPRTLVDFRSTACKRSPRSR